MIIQKYGKPLKTQKDLKKFCDDNFHSFFLTEGNFFYKIFSDNYGFVHYVYMGKDSINCFMFGSEYEAESIEDVFSGEEYYPIQPVKLVDCSWKLLEETEGPIIL